MSFRHVMCYFIRLVFEANIWKMSWKWVCVFPVTGHTHEEAARRPCVWDVLGVIPAPGSELPARDPMQGHLALMHAKSIFVMPKSSLSFGLQILSLGGLGLHVGVANTRWIRVLQFLLCFVGTSFLGTFLKTLNWSGLTAVYFAC